MSATKSVLACWFQKASCGLPVPLKSAKHWSWCWVAPVFLMVWHPRAHRASSPCPGSAATRPGCFGSRRRTPGPGSHRRRYRRRLRPLRWEGSLFRSHNDPTRFWFGDTTPGPAPSRGRRGRSRSGHPCRGPRPARPSADGRWWARANRHGGCSGAASADPKPRPGRSVRLCWLVRGSHAGNSDCPLQSPVRPGET